MLNTRIARLLAVASILAPAPERAMAASSDAETALSRCLDSPDRPFPAEALGVPAPPGLTHGTDVDIAVTPDGGGRLFLLRGRGNDLECGVAIYGPVPAGGRDALFALLDRQPGWRRREPIPDAVTRALPVRQVFWEDVLAPGLAGAAMTLRAPGVGRPTLEVAVRHVLVR